MNCKDFLCCVLTTIYVANSKADFSKSIHPSYHHQATVDYDGILNIKLEHDLSENQSLQFTERANISIPSVRLGQSTVTNSPLSVEDQKQIRKLAMNNELYTVKASVMENDRVEKSFISSIKACMLAESELNDIISINLDFNGKVISVTNVIASTSTCEGADVPLESLKEFYTNVFVRHSQTGPQPDTATYIQQLEREKEAREKGDLKDNRSFLAKYWMYILPVVIIMVLSSAANPEAGAAGSGAAR